MSVKFKSLSSGTCGNCYFIGIFGEDGHCEEGVLIDAGVSPRRLKKELMADGIGMDDFSCILVTHDHMDHVRSLGSFCKHIHKNVWATSVLHSALARHSMCCEWIGSYSRTLETGWNDVVPGRIRVRWFEVPHDATQTVGYAILLDDYRFVIMTDIGRMTEEAMTLARQADTVVIESNYDTYMLEHGPYPRELQDRIRDGHGHLSNVECAEAIRLFRHPGLKNVFLCHLSDHNNTPELAYKTCKPSLADDFGTVRLAPLPRQTASPLFNL